MKFWLMTPRIARLNRPVSDTVHVPAQSLSPDPDHLTIDCRCHKKWGPKSAHSLVYVCKHKGRTSMQCRSLCKSRHAAHITLFYQPLFPAPFPFFWHPPPTGECRSLSKLGFPFLLRICTKKLTESFPSQKRVMKHSLWLYESYTFGLSLKVTEFSMYKHFKLKK